MHEGRYGKTSDEAFQRVRSLVPTVSEASSRGDMSHIDSIDLGPACRWKIAFHYQSPTDPQVLAIFKREPLWRLLKVPPANGPLEPLCQPVLAHKPTGMTLFDFGREIYAQ